MVQGGLSRSVFSTGAQSAHTRGIGFYLSNGEIISVEAKHVDASDTAISTRPVTLGAPHGNQSKRNAKPLRHASSKATTKCSTSEGRTAHSGAGTEGRRGPQREPLRSFPVLEKACSLHTSSSTWLGQNRSEDQKHCSANQKRDISFSEQTVRPAANEQLQRPRISDVDEAVGGRGQPPLSQPLEGPLVPLSPEEEKIAPVLARPDLLITRNVEWANLAFGFEQPNKYVIMDPHHPQAPVGYVIENSNVLLRQASGLWIRRPFTSSVLNANRDEVFRVRRPAFFINSSIYVEVNGKVLGSCHRRWHLWKRIYDVYVGNKQFGVVENPGFWHWTFTLKDEQGRVLAEIDRNWRGFGYEFLTDAGQYVVRFGDVLPKGSSHYATPVLEEGQDRKPLLSSKSDKTGAEEMQQLQEAAKQAEALAVVRPLSLSERVVTLALAVSLDNDYFSRHSRAGVGIPLPLPFYTSGAASDDDDTPAGTSLSGNEAETGYEVFPRGGGGGSRPDDTADAVPAAPPGANDEMLGDDPFFGMFDEQQQPRDHNDDQFFNDPDPHADDAGDNWGLSDWGIGDGGDGGGGD